MTAEKTAPVHEHPFLTFLKSKNHKIARIAKLADITPSVLYNLSGHPERSLRTETMVKIAAALKMSLDELTAFFVVDASAMPQRTATVVGVIGNGGQMFEVSGADETVPVFDSQEKLKAVRVDSDSLYPIKAGYVFVEAASCDPEAALGRAALIRYAGSTRAVLGNLRRGTKLGLYTIDPWSRAAPIEDVEVKEVNLFVSLSRS